MMRAWVQISPALYDTEIHRCSFCGKMVVNRFWEVEEQGRTFKFCDPECEAYWYDYWLPRYAASIGLQPAKQGDSASENS